MDKQRIETTARALHETMRRTPDLWRWSGGWEHLPTYVQSQYRALAHSCLVASSAQQIWVVTDESNCSTEEQKMTSAIVVADSREEALAYLADHYGGADECVWEEQSANGDCATEYGEYRWVMAPFTVQRSS